MRFYRKLPQPRQGQVFKSTVRGKKNPPDAISSSIRNFEGSLPPKHVLKRIKTPLK
jgi:hypothetical protein